MSQNHMEDCPWFWGKNKNVLSWWLCKYVVQYVQCPIGCANICLLINSLSSCYTMPNITQWVGQMVPQWEWVVLHCTALYCTVLRCTALHCTALHCTALHCTALHCTALHCTALHCTVYCTALQCTSLHITARFPCCTTLHCTKLNCIALHCTALHCIKLIWTVL